MTNLKKFCFELTFVIVVIVASVAAVAAVAAVVAIVDCIMIVAATALEATTGHLLLRPQTF